MKGYRWFHNIHWDKTCIECQQKAGGFCKKKQCAEFHYDEWGDRIPTHLYHCDGNDVEKYLVNKRIQMLKEGIPILEEDERYKSIPNGVRRENINNYFLAFPNASVADCRRYFGYSIETIRRHRDSREVPLMARQINLLELQYASQFEELGFVHLEDMLERMTIWELNRKIIDLYVSCCLGRKACEELVAVLQGANVWIKIPDDCYPDIERLPKEFSNPADSYDIEHTQVMNFIYWKLSSGYNNERIYQNLFAYEKHNFPLNLVKEALGDDEEFTEYYLCKHIKSHREKWLDMLQGEIEKMPPLRRLLVKMNYQYYVSVESVFEYLQLPLWPTLTWVFIGEYTNEQTHRRLRHPVFRRKVRNLLREESVNIDALDLSIRSFDCLKRAGICTVDSLLCMNCDDVMRMRNLGRKSLEEITEEMHALGYTEWPKGYEEDFREEK